MKYLIIAACLATAPAIAQPPSNPGPTQTQAPDPNQQVCRNINRVGSRLDRQRICMTRAQWDQQRRDSRQNLDRMQNSRATNGN